MYLFFNFIEGALPAVFAANALVALVPELDDLLVIHRVLDVPHLLPAHLLSLHELFLVLVLLLFKLIRKVEVLDEGGEVLLFVLWTQFMLHEFRDGALFELIVDANSLHHLQESKHLRLMQGDLRWRQLACLFINGSDNQMSLVLRKLKRGRRQRIRHIVVQLQVELNVQVFQEVPVDVPFVDFAFEHFHEVACALAFHLFPELRKTQAITGIDPIAEQGKTFELDRLESQQLFIVDGLTFLSLRPVRPLLLLHAFVVFIGGEDGEFFELEAHAEHLFLRSRLPIAKVDLYRVRVFKSEVNIFDGDAEIVHDPRQQLLGEARPRLSLALLENEFVLEEELVLIEQVLVLLLECFPLQADVPVLPLLELHEAKDIFYLDFERRLKHIPERYLDVDQANATILQRER